MATENKCPHCGKPVPATALQGICPECMLKAGVAETGEVGPGGTLVAKPPSPPAPGVAEIAPHFPQLELLECLGRGGMGAVYKARQPKLDRFVALKILTRNRSNGTTDTEFAERFQREARALARLNHPDIVAVHDFGEAGGYHFLLMEYVDGLTLRQLFQSRKLSPEEALAIVPKICGALQFAHERGIVHRDIKPENILLDKQGRVKIADFGIAKIVGQSAQASLTQEKQVIGTPHYMAPEQVEKPATVDHRADIYSLGVVFYEMLTGELPLGKFQPPSRKVQVDVRLDEVVLHALEKEPDRRYQHASEVKSDVESITNSRRAESSISTDAATPNVEAKVKSLGWRRRPLPSFAVFVLPTMLFAWFLFVGHRMLGVDLDADVQFWVGCIGLTASAAVGALLVWALRLSAGGGAATDSTNKWSWLALGGVAALVVSLPLGGAASVMLHLISLDSRWNPGGGEAAFVIGLTAGAALTAAATILCGIAATRQINKAGGRLRGQSIAFAATYFWPCLAAVFLLSGFAGGRKAPARQQLQELEARHRAEAEALRSALIATRVPPVVVKTIPAAGNRDVDPALTEIRVTFSKPMQDGNWSWNQWSDESFPQMTGEPKYLDDQRTCVLPVRLMPGKVYAIWVNSEQRNNFKDREGRAALPYLLIFETRNQP